MVAGRPLKLTEPEVIELGHEFVKWATNNPQALSVPMFAGTKGINSHIMREWTKQYPEFSTLYANAKEQIGLNRLRSAHSPIQKENEIKLDMSVYRGTIWHYDLDVKLDIREEKAYESSLKQESDGKGNTVHVIFPGNSAAHNDGQVPTEGLPKTSP